MYLLNIFDYLPLDINKSGQEIIIEKVNAVNGLQLNFNDFVFENPEHDFPTAITYNFLGGDKLKASISGVVNEQVRSLDFDYIKTK